jgi:DNA-binding transcriptional LysR family regulator
MSRDTRYPIIAASLFLRPQYDPTRRAGRDLAIGLLRLAKAAGLRNWRGAIVSRDKPRRQRFQHFGRGGVRQAPHCPAVGRLRRSSSGLDVHLVLSDAGLEVGQDGLDVALRIDRPDDPSIITRKIAATKRIVCAAPSYLAARGTPTKPADLADHECLRLARRHRLHDQWRFRTETGSEEMRVGGHLSGGSGDVLHGWALEGRGLSLEALWDVAEDLESGRLVECLADFWCDSIELFAAFLPGRPIPPRIRLFVDFIAALAGPQVPHADQVSAATSTTASANA